MTRVLLYSGGMDSYICRAIWGPDKLVYVDIQTGYAHQEMIRLPPNVEIVDFDALGQFELKDGIVPMRNLFFVALGALFGERVAFGATASDFCNDKTFTFAAHMSDLMSYLYDDHWSDRRVRTQVEMPLKPFTKAQAIKLYVDQGHSLEALAEETISCYEPENDKECGKCKPCLRKWTALAANQYPLRSDILELFRDHIIPTAKEQLRDPDKDRIFISKTTHFGRAGMLDMLEIVNGLVT